MIVPIDAIPKFEKRVLTDQRKMIYADIELAFQNGYRLFEITGDDYDYESMTGSVVSVLAEYFKNHYFNDIWNECTENLEQHFQDGHRFKLSANTICNLSKRFYKCRSYYDPALGRKRVYVELYFDEEDIRKTIQDIAKQEKDRHAMYVRRKKSAENTKVVRSSFNAPIIGQIIPSDYVRVDKGNGIVQYVPPKKKTEKKKTVKRKTTKKQ